MRSSLGPLGPSKILGACFGYKDKLKAKEMDSFGFLIPWLYWPDISETSVQRKADLLDVKKVFRVERDGLTMDWNVVVR